jgi:hypothetical protein
MSRQRFAGELIKIEGLIENQLRKTARAEPGKVAIISCAPEGKTPITGESVPAEECGLSCDPGHRLGWVACDLANVAEANH